MKCEWDTKLKKLLLLSSLSMILLQSKSKTKGGNKKRFGDTNLFFHPTHVEEGQANKRRAHESKSKRNNEIQSGQALAGEIKAKQDN